MAVERIVFQFAQVGARAVRSDVNLLQRALNGIALTTVAIGATTAILKIGEHFAEVGGKVLVAGEQFENTSKTAGALASEFLPALRNAMLGSVSDFDAMRLANFALVSGLNVSASQMERLASVSTKLALVTGRDATEAFQRLVFGIVKNERRILDELGIVVKAKDVYADYAKSVGKTTEALTAQERVQAFLNAVLSAGEEKVRNFSGVNFELATTGLKMSAAFDNFTNKLAEMFVRSGSAERLLSVLAGTLDRIIQTISGEDQGRAFFNGLVDSARAFLGVSEAIFAVFAKLAPAVAAVSRAVSGVLELFGVGRESNRTADLSRNMRNMQIEGSYGPMIN